MAQEYVLGARQQNINTTGLIRQFQVKNLSTAAIYINVGGSVPSPDNSDYIIQPYGSLTSPTVNANQLTVFIPNFIVSDPRAILTAYIDGDAPPPVRDADPTESYVALSGYPRTFTNYADLVSNPLSPITITKFNTVYFSLSYATKDFSTNQTFILNTRDVSGTKIALGAFDALNTLIAYTPKNIPETLTLELTPYLTSGIIPFTFAIFQATTYLEINSLGSEKMYSLTPAGGNAVYYGSANQWGFMFGLEDLGSVAINMTITLQLGSGFNTDNLGIVQLINATIVKTSVALDSPVSYIIPPRIYYTVYPKIVLLSISNIHATNQLNFRPLFKAF